MIVTALLFDRLSFISTEYNPFRNASEHDLVNHLHRLEQLDEEDKDSNAVITGSK